jgi:hypothetical protein
LLSPSSTYAQPQTGCLTGKKAFCGMEQKRFVAVSSRFGNITAPALPQSNLIEVTLFELIAQR